ncbi:metalloprotease [Candidatus Woesearchaeota archaeon]|nr:metalloprotease [Candidatus Woesearchaeota archaeon]
MPIKFSKIELRDLGKAWLFISIAFGIVLSGGVFGASLFKSFILAALTVGTGFLFHELGHKIVAQRYGCYAEFRADNFMLFLAVLTSFLGLILAAPGAVMISGHISKERNGKISIAGPLVNIVLALIFLGLSFIVTTGFFQELVMFGFMVNSWLALFNLLPFWILDGKKVLAWNKGIYFLTMLVTVGLFISGIVLF